MTHHTRVLVRHLLPAAVLSVGCASLLAGCKSPAASAEEKPLPAAVAPYVLDSVPTDVAHRTLIDFENQVQLVAYELEPETPLEDGAEITLRLFWQPLARLQEDPEGRQWTLFTELLGSSGRPQLDGRLEATGVLRDSLPPSEWRPGHVYLDEATVRLPDPLLSAEVQLAVGFERQWEYLARPEEGAGGAGPGEAKKPAVAKAEDEDAAEAEVETVELPMRLRVVSGASDGHGRGIVTRCATQFDPEVAKQKLARRAAAEQAAAAQKARRANPRGQRPTPPGMRPARPAPAQGMLPGRAAPQGRMPGMPGRPPGPPPQGRAPGPQGHPVPPGARPAAGQPQPARRPPPQP